MGRGMKSFAAKQRREQRRRNHIAFDLADRKYRQRIKPTKKPKRNWDEEFEYDGDENLS